MSRSKQNNTNKIQNINFPVNNLNVLNPSMREILKLEENDIDLLAQYRTRNNNYEGEDGKSLMHIHRLSSRKKEIGRMRSKLINENINQEKYTEEVFINREKAEKMAENIFKRRLKHINKSRDDKLTKSKSQFLAAKPQLKESSKSYLVRSGTQNGISGNKRNNKEENKQNLLNRVNMRKSELNPDNYRRRNNAEKPEEYTQNTRNRNNSNYISQTNYSSKSYSNIKDNKRVNVQSTRVIKDSKAEKENINVNIRGIEEKEVNQNKHKRSFKNTIPINNTSSHIVYSSKTNKTQASRAIPTGPIIQKNQSNCTQRGNRVSIPIPNPSKNNIKKEISFQKLPDNMPKGQRKTYQPKILQNENKNNNTRNQKVEQKNIPIGKTKSSSTVTTVGIRRNGTNQNLKIETVNQPLKVENKYQKEVANKQNGNERVKTEDNSKASFKRRNNNSENKICNTESSKKIIVNTGTTSSRRRGPQ
jgi:hypothetical protein